MLVAVLCLTAFAAAQYVQVASGYVSSSFRLTPPPAFLSVVEFDPSGDVLFFDGVDLVRFSETGTTTPLFTPPAGSFGEVLKVDATGTFALLCVSSSYDIYAIDLATGVGVVVGNVPFLYDLAFDSTGALHASIGEGTFSTTSLERLDAVTLTRQIYAVLQGASGPIAVNSADEVLYGTNDFLAASQSVLVFDPTDIATAIMTATPMSEANATTLASGLGGLTGFAIDANDDLYFTDNDFFAAVGLVRRVDPLGLVDTFGTPPAGYNLARVAFEQPATSFDPLTGPSAGRMAFLLSDFATHNLLVLAEPSRPSGRIYGDCNGDGTVSITDALSAAQADIGLISLTRINRALCEVDGNATVNIVDALQIARASSGQSVFLGY